MSKYLIEMQDGGILDIKDDCWCVYEGCETCGYGGLYTEEIILVMDDCNIKINMKDMYDWNMPSYDKLIKWFDNNTEKIKKMNRSEFVHLLKYSDIFNFDEVKFFIEEV